MASMHINGSKPTRDSRAVEVESSSSDEVFDERISHVAERYQGTTTDQHGKYFNDRIAIIT